MKVPSIKQPSAFLPLAMSLTALAIVLGHAAIYGIVHEADEGTAAHLFQLLMAAQLPIVAYFVIKWLRVSPQRTVRILVLQAVAGFAAFVAVYYLT